MPIQSQLKPCIAVDWLQCTVKMPCRDFEKVFNPLQQHIVKDGADFKIAQVINEELKALSEKYEVKRTGIQTRNFKAIYEVKDRASGEDIAVIAAEPRSLMCMSEDTALIKIINKYLYQKNFSHFVRVLFKDLRLTFMNITRLDVAYDFERFDTMGCDDFIRRVMGERYIKTIKAETVKAMGPSISVDKGKKTGGWCSLKYGKETSDVNYYLYNKTKELKDVKHKPWIFDHWKANGWQQETEVYRLEFSLRPDTKGIPVADQETGEICDILHFKDLSMLDSIDKIFEFHFNKHFQFVRAERTVKGNWKKQSRCTPVKLFKNLTFESVKIDLSNKKDSGRSDKIFAKKLMELNRELRGCGDFDLAIAGNELMTLVIKGRDLQTWAQKKFPDLYFSERVDEVLEKSRLAKISMEITRQRDMPKLYKAHGVQEKELQEVEAQIRQKSMEITTDGKIVSYDADGNFAGFITQPF